MTELISLPLFFRSFMLWRLPFGAGVPRGLMDVPLVRHICPMLIVCLGEEFLAASVLLDFDVSSFSVCRQ